MPEKSLFSFDNIKTSLVTVFFIGCAWTRLEYKMDEMNTATKVLLEKYVLTNDFEKKMLSYRIDELKAQVDINTMTIKAITEFIKPDEIKRKKYR